MTDQEELIVRRGKRSALLALVAVGLLTGALSFTLFRYDSYNCDVPGYKFAAETLLLGKTYVPVPKSRDFFRTWMVQQDRERMYSRYPPGWPLLMALLKTVLREYRLLPPVVAMLGMCFYILIIRDLFGWGAVRYAAWLPVLSPFFLFTGSTLLSHGATFLFLSAGTWGWIKLEKTGDWRWGLLAGAGFGWAFITRQLTGLFFILGLIAYELLTLKRRTWGDLPRRWGGALLTGGAMLALLLAYNHSITGSATSFPFLRYWPRDRIGFHQNLGRDSVSEVTREEHTPARGFRQMRWMYIRLDRWLFFLLPCGASVALLLGLLGYNRFREQASLFFLQTAFVIFGQVLFFSMGPCSGGPSYWYELCLPLFVFAAASTEKIVGLLKRVPRRGGIGLVAALLLIGALTRGEIYSDSWKLQADTAYHNGMYARCAEQAEKPALVLLNAELDYVGNPVANLRNDPLLQNEVLFAIQPYQGEVIGALRKHFPGRNLYFLTADDNRIPALHRLEEVPPVPEEYLRSRNLPR
jgi:hypothetical protein